LLVERHAGVVPRSFEALESLPGVGHKTASVVMSQAFGVPAFPVDTHIHRLARRWRLSSGQKCRPDRTISNQLFPSRECGTNYTCGSSSMDVNMHRARMRWLDL
jgi:endonuclease III